MSDPMPTGQRNSTGKRLPGGKQRKSTAELEKSGTLKRNPEKYEDRLKEPKKGLRPIGDPPGYFNESERDAWFEVLHTVHVGTVFEEDRFAVEQFARVMVRLRNGTANATTYNRFFHFLKLFGLTPADRSRVTVQEDAIGADNPFAGFTQ